MVLTESTYTSEITSAVTTEPLAVLLNHRFTSGSDNICLWFGFNNSFHITISIILEF